MNSLISKTNHVTEMFENLIKKMRMPWDRNGADIFAGILFLVVNKATMYFRDKSDLIEKLFCIWHRSITTINKTPSSHH